jgi:hypothetical protein
VRPHSNAEVSYYNDKGSSYFVEFVVAAETHFLLYNTGMEKWYFVSLTALENLIVKLEKVIG